jgi:hypothetical protein
VPLRPRPVALRMRVPLHPRPVALRRLCNRVPLHPRPVPLRRLHNRVPLRPRPIALLPERRLSPRALPRTLRGIPRSDLPAPRLRALAQALRRPGLLRHAWGIERSREILVNAGDRSAEANPRRARGAESSGDDPCRATAASELPLMPVGSKYHAIFLPRRGRAGHISQQLWHGAPPARSAGTEGAVTLRFRGLSAG